MSELKFWKSLALFVLDTLPTFGPSYLYFYRGENCSFYTGKLLFSLSTEVVHNRSISPRKCQTTSIPVALDASKYFKEEKFLMKLIVLNVLVFDAVKPSKIKISLKCLDNRSNVVELKLDKLAISKVRYATFKESSLRPVLTVGFECPDFRWKYHPLIALHRTLKLGERLLEKFELFRVDNGVGRADRLKLAILDVINGIGESIGKARILLYARNDNRYTHWDHKWMLNAVQQIVSLSYFQFNQSFKLN